MSYIYDPSSEGLAELVEADLATRVDAYHPDDEAKRLGGNLTRKLPETIYSAPILAVLNAYDRGSLSMAYLIVPNFLSLFVSVALQAVLGVYLHTAVVRVDSTSIAPTCGAADALLRNASLFAFGAVVLADVYETYGMHAWLCELRTVPVRARLTVRAFKDVHSPPALGYVPIITRPVTGITRGERALFYATCIVPKILIALICTLAGAGAILRASNDFDLVLASVAAGFILALDDGLYKLLISDSVRKIVGCAPAFGVPTRAISTLQRRWTFLQAYATPLVVLLLGDVLEHFYWCAQTADGHSRASLTSDLTLLAFVAALALLAVAWTILFVDAG